MAPRTASDDRETKSTKEENITFGWKNISYSVRTNSGTKEILRNVSGIVKSGQILPTLEAGLTDTGELLAILGPSGCGKSTLLNILSRRLKGPDVTGDQLLNQSAFSDAQLRSISTYVEQEDYLVGCLTVAETVGFAAKLALPVNPLRLSLMLGCRFDRPLTANSGYDQRFWTSIGPSQLHRNPVEKRDQWGGKAESNDCKSTHYSSKDHFPWYESNVAL